MIGLRKALDWVFTQRELKILDDIMPETIKRTEEELRLGDAVSSPSLYIIFILFCVVKSTINEKYFYFTGRKTNRFRAIFWKSSNTVSKREYYENSFIINKYFRRG